MKKTICQRVICSLMIIVMMMLVLVSLALCEQEPWYCPECGNTDNDDNFCGWCGCPSPSQLTIGSIISFGKYEQDNNPDNGPEEIKWIVLSIQDQKCLLLSRYGLNALPYNSYPYEITWEKCSLRDWLNHNFLQAAFSEEQKKHILYTDIDNSDKQTAGKSERDNGKNTIDRVYLLSSYEYSGYLDLLDGITSRKCTPTEFAIANGADVFYEDLPIGWWWLRSPGADNHCTSAVSLSGENVQGRTDDPHALVRPVIWVDLSLYADPTAQVGMVALPVSFIEMETDDMEIPDLHEKTYSVGDMNLYVLWIQEQLKGYGFYTGHITGNMGNMTREAIAAFMKKRGYNNHNGEFNQTVVDEMVKYIKDEQKRNFVPVKIGGFYKYMDQIMDGGHTGGLDHIDMKEKNKTSRMTLCIKWVQTCLHTLGYYQGIISGDYDKQTQEAVMKYQDAHDNGDDKNITYITLGGIRSMLEEYYYAGYNLDNLP